MNIKPVQLKVFVAAVFSVALVALCSTQAYAEKPEQSGMKKTQKKMEIHQRESKEGRLERQGERGKRDVEESGLEGLGPELSGLDKSGQEKQREKKMDQERKELGKGSEKGQQMREEHSRKWWKFWGE